MRRHVIIMRRGTFVKNLHVTWSHLVSYRLQTLLRRTTQTDCTTKAQPLTNNWAMCSKIFIHKSDKQLNIFDIQTLFTYVYITEISICVQTTHVRSKHFIKNATTVISFIGNICLMIWYDWQHLLWLIRNVHVLAHKACHILHYAGRHELHQSIHFSPIIIV